MSKKHEYEYFDEEKKEEGGEKESSFKGSQDLMHELKGKYDGFYYEFQKFMYANDIIVAAVGFTIGMVTKDMIMSVLHDIFIPVFLGIGSLQSIKSLKNSAMANIPGLSMLTIQFGNILWTVFVWFLTILLTFLILEYFFNRFILGLKTMVPEEEKQNFILARLSSRGIPVDEKDYKKYKDKVDNA